MKFTQSFLIAALPVFVSAAPSWRRANGGAVSTTDITTNATANNPNPQSSLTLISSVIATGFAQNGQAVQEAGQVASLTSNNNFINFCATVPQLPIMNGQQIKTGSCNPAPMGIIAATTNMPSAKFVFPANGDTSIQPNTAFTIKLAVNHLQTGNFVNAQQSYFAAPQQVDAQGDVIGHTHVVVEALTSLAQTTPTDPTTFAFFKGVNTAAVGGVVTADVTAGLPAGFYKLSTINSAANHQPVLVAVAQHGSLDDAVYFTVGQGGSNVAGEDSAAQAAASSVAAAAAAATAGAGGAAAAASSAAAQNGAGAGAAAATATATAAAGTGKGGNKGQQGAGSAAGNKGQQGAGAAAGKGGFGGFQGKNGRRFFGREY